MTGDGPAAAVAALSAALSADPGRGDLWSELATVLVAAGRPREAWDAAARAVELAPQSAASHRAIGTVAVALGDPRQAESAYRHALLLDPADHATRTALARIPAGPGPAPPAAAAVPGHGSAVGPALPATAAPGYGSAAASAPTGGRRRAPEPVDGLLADAEPSPPAGRRRAREDGGPGVPAPRISGSRHAAPESGAPGPDGQPSSGGRRRAPEPTGGGRRRAPETAMGSGGPGPADAVPGGRRRASEVDPGEVAGRHGAATALGRASEVDSGEVAGRHGAATAVGLPGWLAPSTGRHDALTTTTVAPDAGVPGPPPVPVGATRVADPDAWHQGLVAAVRIEWLVGVTCFVGLAYARTAPYTAGLLAGAIVVAAAYGRVRWQPAHTLRPPARDRVPTYAAAAAVLVAVVVVPAAMFGALTIARLATATAVTCATLAAVLMGRTRA